MSIRRYRQRGLTLVEILIALVIGLLLLAGSMALFTSSRSTYDSNESRATMIDGARFAMQSMGYDLRLAGSFGPVNDPKAIDHRKGTRRELNKLASGDCSDLFYADLERKVYVVNGNSHLSRCVTGHKRGTDILVVRYAAPRPLAEDQLVNNQVYVQSTYGGGKLFIGTTPPAVSQRATSISRIRKLITHVYYISKHSQGTDNVPALRRISLQVGPSMKNEVLVSGVDDLQVQLGISNCAGARSSTGLCSSQERYIAHYVNANNRNYFSDVNWSNSLEVNAIEAVRLSLLIRSPISQRLGSKRKVSFELADSSIGFKDGIPRMVFHGTYKVRNHSS